MYRTLLSLILITAALISQGQAIDKYVRFNGKVLSQKDSSGISASIYYEKLPYYDDMGTAKSGPQGNYEFYLINGDKYNFRITLNGFLELTRELTVTNANGDGSMNFDFYLEPEEEPELITLNNLIFARGSDVITESSFEELDNLVEYLDSRPSLIIQLEGHTDFAGNPEANMSLSEARVVAVKEYLVSKGVKKNRVLTKAFGGSQPLYTERTDEAKTKNRRVEVRVISR
ncbi:OmpA family protein [Marinoscillum sp. 108]|uniref:OmpA family protein n=1 Tax=Marinoscillum sp. 108 TaxID=2653151 RepID=UPI0012F32659|nr:OmpA family protein [Marinoscillum sp. 108]VXD18565.1 Outer membrane protein OmpA-like peptidoglycan-associated protein [Marinoscillum sp. 108]